MKRGRILSLFLSAVLLVSAIIPCLQLSVNADKANAISEIKTAWNQLEYKILEGFKASKNDDKDTDWNIPLTETTTVDDKANFGSYKFTINAANVNKASKWKGGCQWFLVNPSKANFLDVMAPEDMGDIYLNVASNKEVKLRIGYRVDFSFKDAAGVTKPHYTVIYSDFSTVPGDGTVTKLSGFKDDMADFQDVADAYVKGNQTLSSATDVTLTRFESVRLFITPSDFTGDAELTVGMGMVINNSSPTFPAEFNDSDDLVAIIDAAEDAVKSEI